MCSLLELASANLDRKHGSILAAMKSLEGYRFSAVYSLSDPCDRCRVQAGVEVSRMHSDHLLSAVTQALTSLPIDLENGLVLIEQEEAIRRVIDEAAKALLARAQRVLRLLAMRDVPEVHDESVHARLAEQIGHGVLNPEPLAMFMTKEPLGPVDAAGAPA